MEWRYGTKTKEILEAVPEGSENAVNALYLSALFGQDVTPHLANLYKQGKVRREKRNNLYHYWKATDHEERTGLKPLSVLGQVFDVPGIGKMIAWNGVRESFGNGGERHTFTCLCPDPDNLDRYREATVIVTISTVQKV
jgi:hypothetical protein